MRMWICAALAAIVAGTGGSWAQTYPTRPITMIVPFPPGGVIDPVGRIMAERMRASLGQPIVIENIPGANGNIGFARVARAAPDGYSLGLGSWNTHVSNAETYKLSYDVLSDFEPVSLLVRYSFVTVGSKTFAAKDAQELVTWLKLNPDKASQGSAGTGSGGHVTGLLFQKMTGTRFQHVPYRGSAAAMQDLVAGIIDLVFDAPAVVLPQVRAGSIKAFAVAAKSRLLLAPDLPTMDEVGVPGFYASNWFAFWTPKGIPKSIIARLNTAAVDALADPAVRRRLTDLGFEIFPREEQTAETLALWQKAEIEKWWPIIKAANIKGE
jgi:tripartite-type tricarboxylate transporter receptor subunit TctC